MHKLKQINNKLINNIQISRKVASNKVKMYIKYIKMKKKLAENLHFNISTKSFLGEEALESLVIFCHPL